MIQAEPWLEAGPIASKIRICLFVDSVGYHAGTERQVIQTLQRMDSGRFEIHLCCFEDSPQFQEASRYCRSQLFPLSSLAGMNAAVQTWRFRRYLKTHRIQVVHAFMVKTAIVGVLAALACPEVIVVTSRLSTGYWYTPSLVRLFKVLNRFTSRVMANSEAVKSITVRAETLESSKVDVVYQGVDLTKFGPGQGDGQVASRLGIPESALVVGIVANLRPVKDIPLFLNAAKLVTSAVPSAVFLIVGVGPLHAQLADLAAELGIANKVFFSDGKGTVPDYLRRICIGCLTSESEGFSNAILEYMATGIPVVATDVGGNREAIVDGETGYLVGERSPGAFAAPIIALLSDEGLRRQMGLRGLERCQKAFEIDACIRRLETYYLSLLALKLKE